MHLVPQVQWLLMHNEKLKAQKDESLVDGAESKSLAAALKKAREHGFFLGMESKWMDT
jgi:hypothetical protein